MGAERRRVGFAPMTSLCSGLVRQRCVSLRGFPPRWARRVWRGQKKLVRAAYTIGSKKIPGAVMCGTERWREFPMQEQSPWQALRTCDALVEHAIAAGAYPEALDHLVRGYQRVVVSFCRTQLG